METSATQQNEAGLPAGNAGVARREFEMTDDDFQQLLDACRPVPYIVAGGVEPMTPQESANLAWQSLGERMGFDHWTVRPVMGKPGRFFTAIPTTQVGTPATETRLTE